MIERGEAKARLEHGFWDPMSAQGVADHGFADVSTDNVYNANLLASRITKLGLQSIGKSFRNRYRAICKETPFIMLTMLTFTLSMPICLDKTRNRLSLILSIHRAFIIYCRS